MGMSPAYVAGLIDGEGCVHLGVRKGTYRARVTVGMTDPALTLLIGLRQTWLGGIYCHRGATDRWAAAWMWSVQGEPARALLTAIRPFLVLKRQQAELALRVEAIRATLPRRPNGSGSWTPEARVQCEQIKAELHLLNRRGPRVPAPTAVGA